MNAVFLCLVILDLDLAITSQYGGSDVPWECNLFIHFRRTSVSTDFCIAFRLALYSVAFLKVTYFERLFSVLFSIILLFVSLPCSYLALVTFCPSEPIWITVSLCYDNWTLLTLFPPHPLSLTSLHWFLNLEAPRVAHLRLISSDTILQNSLLMYARSCHYSPAKQLLKLQITSKAQLISF